MNDEVRLALLEALLARVRSRSRAPHAPAHRPPLRAGPSPLAAAASQPPIRPKYTARPELPANLFATSQPEPHPTLRDSDRWRVSAQGVKVRPAPPSEPAPAVDDGWTSPSFAPGAPPDPPPMEVVELEIDPDPALSPLPPLEDPIPLEPSGQVPAPLESRSRLVAAAPVLADGIEPLEPLDDPDEPGFDDLVPSAPNGQVETADLGNPSDPTIEVAPAPVSHDGEIRKLDAEDEEAPSSSRRPISIEAKMSEPDDLPPLHSPPPASGRLRAALPSLDLTLEREGERIERIEAEPSGLSVIRVEPPARDDVAVFVAPPKAEAGAKTFGELLEDALSI